MATTKTAITTPGMAVNVTITIQNGLPSSPLVNIPNKGTVLFINEDPQVRYLQFFDKGNKNHPVMFVVLQSTESVTVAGGWRPDDQDTCCFYNVRISGDNPSKTMTGGGNKIIIGSTPIKKHKKHKKRAK